MLPLYATAALAYVLWLTSIVDWGVWLGPLLYVAILFSILSTLAFLWMTRTILVPIHRPTKLDRTVDALITTSSEPMSVVERTVRGALAVRGIGYVHVLDDGERPELAMLVENLGAIHYSRNGRVHAKAGNLNFGLQFTDAEFLLILDADHVPKPDFLERTLGYLDDRLVAVVQTPQTYHNDSFLYRRTRRGRWGEQDMFYQCIQPAKNRWNAAFFVGTSAVLRRSAIDDVGGFSTATATEDIHTAVRMHARGWKSVFVPEVLASGLEIQSMRELYQQRRRWAAGSMGLLLRSPDSPLRIRGLTLAQRINYVVSMLGHQQGALRLAFQLLPITCALTLTAPFIVGPLPFVTATAGFIMLTWVAVGLHARGTFHVLHTESTLLAMGFSNIAGLLGTFMPHERFRPARKNARRNERSLVKVALWAIVVLAIAGLTRSVISLVDHSSATRSLALGAAVFIALNLVVLLDFLLGLLVYERREDPVRGLAARATSRRRAVAAHGPDDDVVGHGEGVARKHPPAPHRARAEVLAVDALGGDT